MGSAHWRVVHFDVHGEVILWVTNEHGRCDLCITAECMNSAESVWPVGVSVVL